MKFSPYRYTPADDATWCHVLYGHVPGHQMDFIYEPALPAHSALNLQHFARLRPLVKFLEPHPGDDLAFAIGNLSCGDTQHRPGHGGIALTASLRVPDAIDQIGRHRPVFCHSIVAADLALSADFLHKIGARMLQNFRQNGAETYRKYWNTSEEKRTPILTQYVSALDDLPLPEQSTQDGEHERFEPPPYNRVFVRFGEVGFDAILACASRMAALLYASNLKWTSITTGSEEELPQRADRKQVGLFIRFVRDWGGLKETYEGDPQTRFIDLDEVPVVEADFEDLFGIPVRTTGRARGLANANVATQLLNLEPRPESSASGRSGAAAEAAVATRHPPPSPLPLSSHATVKMEAVAPLPPPPPRRPSGSQRAATALAQAPGAGSAVAEASAVVEPEPMSPLPPSLSRPIWPGWLGGFLLGALCAGGGIHTMHALDGQLPVAPQPPLVAPPPLKVEPQPVDPGIENLATSLNSLIVENDKELDQLQETARQIKCAASAAEDTKEEDAAGIAGASASKALTLLRCAKVVLPMNPAPSGKTFPAPSNCPNVIAEAGGVLKAIWLAGEHHKVAQRVNALKSVYRLDRLTSPCAAGPKPHRQK